MRNRSIAVLKRHLPFVSPMPIPIQRASQASGVSPHVIRIWERRYNALKPSRTCTNRRMYCDEAVLRLKLLRTLTENGHRIGRVAGLCTSELEALASKLPAETVAALQEGWRTPGQFIEAAIIAAKKYDADALRGVLLQAWRLFSQEGMLHQIFCPLTVKVAEEWQRGSLRPGHERIITEVIRVLLLRPPDAIGRDIRDAPEIVVASLTGEAHEIGALLVAASARDQGWQVTYLGPSLPVEEIAACAIARKVRAVGLSIVFPEECPVIKDKLRRLRELLPAGTHLVVGGCAAESYRCCVPAELGVLWANCQHGLDEALQKARR